MFNSFFQIVSLLLLLLCVIITNANQSCPSKDYIWCANTQSSPTCKIPAMTNTTIAYGDSIKNKWTFIDVTNANPDSLPLKIKCNNNNFGNIDNGQSKICCYNANGGMFGDHSFYDDSMYKTVGMNKNSVTLNNYNGLPIWIRYGANGQYTYRLMEQKFECDDETFGDATIAQSINSNEKHCDYYITDYNITSFINCGNNGEDCSLSVSEPADPPQVRIVRYGSNNNNYYRFVYSKTGAIDCNTNVFDLPSGTTKSNNYCTLLKAEATNYFSNNVGEWELIGSVNYPMSFTQTVTQGVTSQSSYAANYSWSQQVQGSISAGLAFGPGSVKGSVSYTTSQSISIAMSHATTITLETSCAVSCTPPENGIAYIWQWKVTTDEQIGFEKEPFDTIQCSYICKFDNQPPQCPLGFCIDSQCTQCYPY